MIHRLREIDNLAEHTKKDTQSALSVALPSVELSFMNNLLAKVEKKEHSTVDIRNILFSHEWSINARATNVFSAKFKQATFMHLLEFHSASLQILNGLKRLLDPCNISI